MKKTIVSLAVLVFAANSFASDIRLGQPTYGGNGCPQGTASAAISPDGKALSILFDEFMVEAGGDSRRSAARKSCNIAIPVHVPQGYSLSIFKVDYRGFNSLPYGAYARFQVEYFFAGSRGPRYRKTFRGPQDDDYLIRNKIVARSVVWSRCGADVNLRANASMFVRTNRRKEEALSTVDSVDVNAGLIFNLKWKRC